MDLLTQAFSLQQSGRLADAYTLFKYVLSQQPNNVELLIHLGTLALHLGEYAESTQFNRQALAINSELAVAHCHLGLAMLHSGELDEALSCFNYALLINPGYVEAIYNQAQVFGRVQHHQQALACYQQVLVLKPDYVDAWYSLGNSQFKLQQYQAAVASYERAVSLQADYVGAYCGKAMALLALNRYAEALECCDEALAYKPDFAEAYVNKADVLKALQQPEQALVCYEQALHLSQNNAHAYCRRGILLNSLERFEQALADFERAIICNPNTLEAYFNRGVALTELQRFDEANASYDRAIACDPGYAGSYWNKALLQLLLGHYQQGWLLYEWGLQTGQRLPRRMTDKPLWLGEQSLANQTLLIVAEQGLGDVLQFCRYVPLLRALGVRIVLEVQVSLLTICATLAEGIVLVERNQPLPDFDYYCPIMSLPLAFKTELASVPATVPYLYADKLRQQGWQQQLAESHHFKVGLVWSGSAVHRNDHHRSMSLQQLAGLLALPVDYHVLQKDIPLEDEVLVAAYPNLYDHHQALTDFADTAALLSCMDLVITVDTSVAHLAGALGKPVWILLPYLPDFRWLLERSDSPWYPTATLFRQDASRQWGGVLAEVRARLEGVL